jgi:Kef-type K+ transport system membrane component KefB
VNHETLVSLTVILAMVVLAPLVSDHIARWIVIPTIVLELALGILIGPYVLGWAQQGTVITALSQFGLVFLLFLAGYEINFALLRGTPLRLAIIGWFTSLALALIVVGLGSGVSTRTSVIALALCTTALGTLLPILRDQGALGSPFGARVMAIGAVGEFAPIVAISVVLTSDEPLRSTILLGIFVVVAFGAALLARRPRPERVSRLVVATLDSSAQFAIRIVLFILIALVLLATSFSLDELLGSFAAGLVVRLAMNSVDDRHQERIEAKLDAIGFGFTIPVFFVVSGMGIDITALGSVKGIVLTLASLLALLVFRGVPVLLLHRHDLARRTDRFALALYAGSALPLIVVITGIGLDDGVLTQTAAAAMVAGGALSVLIYPQLATRLRGGRHMRPPDEALVGAEKERP